MKEPIFALCPVFNGGFNWTKVSILHENRASAACELLTVFYKAAPLEDKWIKCPVQGLCR